MEYYAEKKSNRPPEKLVIGDQRRRMSMHARCQRFTDQTDEAAKSNRRADGPEIIDVASATMSKYDEYSIRWSWPYSPWAP
jgi:hypothetical protein